MAFTLTCSTAIPIASRQHLADLITSRRQLGPLEHHGRIDVDHRQSALGDENDRRAQQLDRVGVSIALVGVGELMADVGQAGRAEQRVDDRVREHVGV